jgi:hypothetical protein
MARKEQKSEKKDRPVSAAKAKENAPKAVAAAPVSARPGKTKAREGCAMARCNCVSEYQDARYGQGMRVFNIGRAAGACTVCGAKKSV